MAAGQGFKTFTTGEVLTAGDVNGYLMQGINVFADAAARDAAITAPAEGQFAFTKDNNSLWYYDGAAWVASGATGDIEGVTVTSPITGGGTSGTVNIGIDSTAVVPSQTGNSGKYLTTNGTASSWATLDAGGKLKQVVAATYGTQVDSTTTTPVSSGLAVTITPTSSTSKILILANINCGTTGAGSNGGALRLYRGGGEVNKFGDRIGYNGSSVYSMIGPVGVNYLDSPATTSATTYTIYMNSVGTQSFSTNYQSVTSSIVALEIGA